MKKAILVMVIMSLIAISLLAFMCIPSLADDRTESEGIDSEGVIQRVGYIPAAAAADGTKADDTSQPDAVTLIAAAAFTAVCAGWIYRCFSFRRA